MINEEIKSEIKKFETEVIDLKKTLSDGGIIEDTILFYPISRKFRISFLLYNVGQENIGLQEIANDYARIIMEFDTLIIEYKELLISRITKSIQQQKEIFPEFFDYFSDIEGWTQEADHALHQRDGLEFLLMELNKMSDCEEINKNVSSLDLGFKCIYTQEIEDIIKFGCNFEIPYYPDRFWWRHPSKILAEKQARMKQHSE